MNASKMWTILYPKKCPSMFLPILSLVISMLLLLLQAISTDALGAQDAETKAYIVYMGEKKHNDVELITSSHHEMLASVLGSKDAAINSVIYSYRHGFSGFAAKMTESQAQTIAALPGVIKVLPNRIYKQHTTRSWDYLGLSSSSATNLLHDANQGDGVIIGVLDSGVWPESEPFNDKGLGPIPSRWKGLCQSGTGFNPAKNCNRKLIGARYFIDGFRAAFGEYNATENNEFESPRDALGHGTHCSSIAAGSFVSNVSFNGLARGTIRGGAPRARVAMYKVLFNNGASSIDVLKGFDEAIHDGVDVLSVSLGLDLPLNAEIDKQDIIYYGSFHAVAHGIVVVCSAGNAGPKYQTVIDVAPWVISVAASTIDRSFPTPIILGNNQVLGGQSMYAGNDTGFVSLFHKAREDVFAETYCEGITANDTWVVGRVVLCFTPEGGLAEIDQAANIVTQTGGLGIIAAAENNFPPLASYPASFPVILVTFDVGTKILNYIKFTKEPSVRLKPATTYTGKQASTYIASFSSRGPNSLSPAVLKPDIAAPGVDVLAAYIPSPVTVGSRGIYAFASGTSMAAPHVAGIAALLKSLHPNWSPAAIRSAIVTTAWTTDPYSKEPIFAKESRSRIADPLDYGGGVINPNAARNPGLVYDMGTEDYINYLCAIGYNQTAIAQLTNKARNTCSHSVLDLNLPSITIPNLRGSVTITRTVTNVGNPVANYEVVINPPQGIIVKVSPNRLLFNSQVKKISFKVTISTLHEVTTEYYFGSFTWTDGMHNVKIPISVKTEFPQVYGN